MNKHITLFGWLVLGISTDLNVLGLLRHRDDKEIHYCIGLILFYIGIEIEVPIDNKRRR